MKKDEQFSDWYRRQFNKLNETPPDDVWENISNELDLNDVWLSLDSNLNYLENRRKIFVRCFYLIPMLFLFIKVGDVSYLTNSNTEKLESNDLATKVNENVIALQSNQKQSNASNFVLKEKVQNVNKSRINFINSIVVSKSYPLNSNANESQVANESILNQGTSQNEQIISRKDSLMNYISSIPLAYNILSENDTLKLKDVSYNLAFDSNLINKKNNKITGFYAGGVFSLNNIWLVNNLTFDGIKGNSLNDAKIKMGYSYGVSLGYNFVNSWGAELNWYINSQQGQSYSMYNEGRYIDRHIKLDYSVINLSFKNRKQGYNCVLKAPSSKNAIFGLNFGILKSGESNSISGTNSQNENVKSSFAPIDYGVRLGYEYEIVAFKKLILSSAIIGDVGFKSIYNGSKNLPGNYSNTRTTSIGFNVGVKYLIK